MNLYTDSVFQFNIEVSDPQCRSSHLTWRGPSARILTIILILLHFFRVLSSPIVTPKSEREKNYVLPEDEDDAKDLIHIQEEAYTDVRTYNFHATGT